MTRQDLTDAPGQAEPLTERVKIEIPKQDHEQLLEEKPDGVPWGFYLTRVRTIGSDESERQQGVMGKDDH